MKRFSLQIKYRSDKGARALEQQCAVRFDHNYEKSRYDNNMKDIHLTCAGQLGKATGAITIPTCFQIATSENSGSN